MRKQFINFEEEEQNTVDFLGKLTKLKQVSVGLKQRNLLASHRNEWVKQYKKLCKLEKEVSGDVERYMENLDKDLEEKYIQFETFKEDKQRNLRELNESIVESRDLFELNIWYQVKSFYGLKKNLDEVGGEEKKEVGNLQKDIKNFLEQMRQITNEEYDFYLRLEQQQESQKKRAKELIENFVIKEENENLEKSFKIHLTEIEQKQSLEQENGENEEDELKEGEQLIAYIDTGLIEEEEKLLVAQYRKALKFLKERYSLETQRVEQEYQKYSWAEMPKGFDEKNQNLIFFKSIRQSYVLSGIPKGRELFWERLGIQFPKISRKNLELVDQILEKQTVRKEKHAGLVNSFQREKRELREKAEQQVMFLLNKKYQETKNQVARLETQSEILRIQEQLEEARKLYEEKQKEKLKEALWLEKLKKEEDEKNKKNWEEHVQKQKIQAIGYQEKKSLENKKALEQQKIKENQELVNKQKLINENKPKVLNRQKHEIEKIQEKNYKKEEKIINLEQEQLRIEKAVENYPFRPQIESDPERLRQQTIAQKQKKQLYDMADKVTLSKVNGYTVNQLMKDMRYRLSSALNDAGLQQTNYANQVLTYLSKPNN